MGLNSHTVEKNSFPGGTMVKNPPANAGDARDVGSVPESNRYPGVGKDNPLQFLCLFISFHLLYL